LDMGGEYGRYRFYFYIYTAQSDPGGLIQFQNQILKFRYQALHLIRSTFAGYAFLS